MKVQSLAQEDALEEGMATLFLENPMDRGDGRVTVHGVAKSRTRLSDEHTHLWASLPKIQIKQMQVRYYPCDSEALF